MKEIRIGKNQCGQRLDKFLQKYLSKAPKSFLYKMLRKKNIKRNGRRAEGSEILCEGDVLTLFLSDATLEKFSGGMGGAGTVSSQEAEEDLVCRRAAPTLDILYENAHIALINKPAGMLSQKASAGDISLVEYFLEYAGGGEIGFRPGICNRLDRNTSGIVIGGKTLSGLQCMSELLRERRIEKYYLAVVQGVMQKKGIWQAWLKKDKKTNKVEILEQDTPGASYIKTGYDPLASDGINTLVRIRLYTGKTHQIRSHLANLGHPILGDPKYGGRVAGSHIKRQLLHAYELKFPLLKGDFADLSEKVFRAELPEDFYKENRVKQLIKKARKDEKL